MKKLFITALFAILMGGFALTANAQEKVTEPQVGSKKVETKNLEAQENKESLEANEYQKQIDEYQAAVNNFVNAYKAGLEQDVTAKNNAADPEKLMKKAQKLHDDLYPYLEKLSQSQQVTFKNVTKLFDNTKNEFLRK